MNSSYSWMEPGWNLTLILKILSLTKERHPQGPFKAFGLQLVSSLGWVGAQLLHCVIQISVWGSDITYTTASLLKVSKDLPGIAEFSSRVKSPPRPFCWYMFSGGHSFGLGGVDRVRRIYRLGQREWNGTSALSNRQLHTVEVELSSPYLCQSVLFLKDSQFICFTFVLNLMQDKNTLQEVSFCSISYPPEALILGSSVLNCKWIPSFKNKCRISKSANSGENPEANWMVGGELTI